MSNHNDNLIDWVTGGGDEGDPAQSSTNVQSNLDGAAAQLGNLTGLMGDIPSTASARPNGTFFDPDDLMEYLQSGGLVFLDPDTGEPIPNPIVWIYRNVDTDTGQVEYEVYIDDES